MSGNCTVDCKAGFYLDDITTYCKCCEAGKYWDSALSQCADGSSYSILDNEICGVIPDPAPSTGEGSE